MANIITNTNELQTILDILAEKGAAAGKTYSDAIREYLPLIIQGSVSSSVAYESFNQEVENITYNLQEQIEFNITNGNTSTANLIVTNNNPKLSCTIQATGMCTYQIDSALKTAQTNVTVSVLPSGSRTAVLRASTGVDATNINWSIASITMDWSL